MKTKNFSVVEWDKWKSQVRNFYKNYLIPSCRDVSPVFIQKPMDNRPYISVDIFGKQIVGLLDSGANVSVVGEKGIKLLEKLNISVLPSKLRNVFTVDGTERSIQGVVDLPINIHDTVQIIPALVVPSLPLFFIFGSDFCNLFKIRIDFKNNVWDIHSDCSHSKIKTSSNSENFLNNFDLFCLDELSLVQRDQMKEVIDTFQEVSSENKLGRTNKIIMNIDTGNAKPFKERQYNMSPFMLKIMNEELNEMLKLGVVETSHSPWNSPVLLVKKASGEFRFCFDGRKLNEVTKHDSYPLPRIDRILNLLRDAKFISSIDLRKSFWQIPLDESSKEKTAFSVPGRGLFHFNVVPFGLVNAAQTQQRLVDSLFGPKFEPHIFTYLDDIIVTSSTFEEHCSLLYEIIKILKEANLTVNLSKCHFFKTSLKYLGFVVDRQGLRTDPDKVSVMVNYPRPSTSTEIKRFIGMCSWYRRFIKDFSTLMAPINCLLKGKKKKQSIQWTQEADSAFVKIKNALVSAPILTSPDFARQFTIQCDASDTGIGGILTQEIDGQERVIAYASRSLSRAERTYTVTERELLSLIFLLEKFRPYVEGTVFRVITDHSSLLWINRLKDPCGRLARWSVKLRQHNFTIIHRKGAQNVVPDFLSRIPGETSSDTQVDIPNEVFLVDIAPIETDKWYISQRTNIIQNPSSYPQWKVENDLIYKLIPSKLFIKSNDVEWKLVVPKSQRSSVLSESHNPPVCAHFGFYKTLKRIQQQYYWPKMRHDILKFVRSCKICQSQKHSNTYQLGLMGAEKSVKYPFQVIAVDIMGPFPRSPRGFAYLLVVADFFTKYTLLCPMRSATAVNIVRFLENQVFLVHGVPQFIICDNGQQFAGKTFKKLVDTYEVQKIWFTPRYSAQCNFVERNNKTIGQAIRCYVDEHRNWDAELSKIQQAINTAFHEVHNYSPAFLNFGRHIPLSGKYYGKVTSTSEFELNPGDRKYFADSKSGISAIYDEVCERLHNAYLRNSKSYNLRRKDFQFQVGDKVWKKNKVLSEAVSKFSAKLAPKYVLTIIRKKISRLVYSLVNMDGTPAGEWHIKDLKPYFGSNSDVSVG